MSDTNVVVVKGNLVRDVELRYTSAGTAFAKGAVANNRGYKGENGWQEYANFFDFTLWGKRAEGLAKHLTKGTPVVITGELRQSRWEQDGQKRSRVEINAQDLSFAGRKRDGGSPPDEVDGDSGFNPDQGEFPDDLPF